MPHNAAVAGISEDATARPRSHHTAVLGHIDGRPIVCGRGNIPVRVYAAERYYPRQACAAVDQ
jgi:hypothetical protein